MAGYTVKQIAEMLDTNQETVRRWIREKKLVAVQTSRKDGNVVDEEELQRFIRSTPKYASRLAAAIIPISPGVGIAALLGNLACGAALDFMVKKKTLVPRVLPEDVKLFVEKSISDLERKIDQKSQAVQQLESEIQELRTQITAYKYLLEQGINESKNALESKTNEQIIKD